MTRLSENCPIPKDIKVRGYARNQVVIGIVHMGIGAFHQALNTEEVLERFGGDWASYGVSLQRPDILNHMIPLYTLLERDGSGGVRLRVIGAGGALCVGKPCCGTRKAQF